MPRAAWHGPVAVFGIALLIRVVFLVESSDYPAFDIPIIDAYEYDHYARQWLAGGGMDTQFFWQPFFYPFFLSCVYFCTGGALLAAKVLQVVLGATTCGLTCVLGRRLFSPAAGLLGGLILAAYGPLIFYEAELLATGWATFWTVALLLLLLRVRARANVPTFVLLGIAGGLAVLTRPLFLPFFGAACAWQVWTMLRVGDTRGRVGRAAAAIAAGFVLPTLPVACQNARITGHFGIMPFSGGINVYLGNHPETNKVATAVGGEWKRIHRQAEREGYWAPYEQQRYFYRQSIAALLADPAGFMKRLAYKAVQFISSREVPRSADVYVVRQWSALQSVLTWKVGGFGFPFGVLLPLAVVGVAARRRQLPAPVVLFLVLYPLMVVLAFVTARYRMPIVPVLATLAAAGALALVQAVCEHQWRKLAGGAAACASIVVAATLPGPFALETLDTETGLDLALGNHYRKIGDQSRAFDCYQRELIAHPDSVPAHTGLGRIMLERGRNAEALSHFEAAVKAKPHLAATHDNYGLALRSIGRLDEAIAALRRAVEAEPSWTKPRVDLGAALLLAGKKSEAVDALREAMLISPDDYRGHLNLGVALDEAGDLNTAIGEFRRAVELRPGDALTHLVLAQALERAGQIEAARREYQFVLRLEPRAEDARRALLRLARPSRPADSRPGGRAAP